MRIPILDLQAIDATIPNILTKLWDPKILRERFVPGINVLGAGIAERKFGEKALWALEKPDKALTLLGYDREKIEGIAPKNKIQILQEEIRKRASQTNEEKRLRTEEIDLAADLGTKRIRIHYGGSYHGGAVFASDNIQDENGSFLSEDNPEFKSLKNFHQKWVGGRGSIEFCLGPGKKKYKTSKGIHKINKTKCYDPKTKSFKPKTTEYHIPDNEDELQYYIKYCQFMAQHFPEAAFCFWVEPNLNYDDNELFQHSYLKGAQSTERCPETYANLVLASATAMRKISSSVRLGINFAFIDIDYVERCLKRIEEREHPSKIIDYVSFNPYRDLPENAGPFWNEDLTNGCGGKGRFDWNTSGISYEEEVLGLMKRLSRVGLVLQVGESGWSAEQTPESERSQAIYNLRGWVLNRFLWVPETPWRLRDPYDSSQEHSYAFVDSRTFKPHPSYHAYQTFNRLFHQDVVPLGKGKSDALPNLQCNVFEDRKNNKILTAVWLAEETGTSKEEQVALKLKRGVLNDVNVINYLGHHHNDSRMDEGVLILKISSCPLIVVEN